jgi:hypothetical protein
MNYKTLGGGLWPKFRKDSVVGWGNMLLKLNVLETGQLQRFPTFRLSERRFASMRSMRSTGSDGIG